MSNFQPIFLLLALDAKLVDLVPIIIASLSSLEVFEASHQQYTFDNLNILPLGLKNSSLNTI